jgi:gamma-glutamylcyclotransferase (GGCT)/AIG2-like uncharacterized protein YtfP
VATPEGAFRVTLHEMSRLFVYGTLRLGSPNRYAQHLANTARHLGPAIIAGCLYRVTTYPALTLPATKQDYVKGDVFEGISTELWQALDEYEGEDYSRELATAELSNGQSVEAYVYRYLLPANALTPIRSGDWYQPDRHLL